MKRSTLEKYLLENQYVRRFKGFSDVRRFLSGKEEYMLILENKYDHDFRIVSVFRRIYKISVFNRIDQSEKYSISYKFNEIYKLDDGFDIANFKFTVGNDREEVSINDLFLPSVEYLNYLLLKRKKEELKRIFSSIL